VVGHDGEAAADPGSTEVERGLDRLLRDIEKLDATLRDLNARTSKRPRQT
jgi:hypothetical protein